jgi:catalase
VSLAQEAYFGVTAYEFLNAAGKKEFGRYRILPEEGKKYLTDAEAAALAPNYHYDEIRERVGRGPIRFKVVVQVAAAGDITNDATVRWQTGRELVELGTIALTEAVKDDAAQQKQMIFDPIPRIDGIEPSADPLLELRAAIYLLSGRRRRTARQEEPAH